MPKPKTPHLSLIPPSRAADPMAPPADLEQPGAELWVAIQAQYRITDAGGLAILRSACEATDMAARCRAQVNKDGLMVTTRTGVKDHPLIRHELGARAFAASALMRLGLSVEPLQRPGRPGGSKVV